MLSGSQLLVGWGVQWEGRRGQSSDCPGPRLCTGLPSKWVQWRGWGVVDRHIRRNGPGAGDLGSVPGLHSGNRVPCSQCLILRVVHTTHRVPRAPPTPASSVPGVPGVPPRAQLLCPAPFWLLLGSHWVELSLESGPGEGQRHTAAAAPTRTTWREIPGGGAIQASPLALQ